jgi:hypothetical protein
MTAALQSSTTKHAFTWGSQILNLKSIEPWRRQDLSSMTMAIPEAKRTCDMAFNLTKGHTSKDMSSWTMESHGARHSFKVSDSLQAV